MAIKYVVGDATYPQGDGLKFIVHCVNDIGAWGKGFVVSLFKRWERPKAEYKKWFKKNETLKLGSIQLVKAEEDIIVVNLVGQHGIYSQNGIPPIRYDAIRKGLQELFQFINKPDCSLHMPRIGTGLARGNWVEIEKIINEELINKGIEVFVYDLPSK